jgi:hypothetical protein
MSWALQAIETEAEWRAVQRLQERLLVKLDTGYRDNALRVCIDFGREKLGDWRYVDVQAPKLLEAIVAEIADQDPASAREYRDELVAGLRAFAAKVAALPLPAPESEPAA